MGEPKTHAVFTGFEFDLALDDSLFATEPPAGYKVVTAQMDLSPPGEKDFAEAMGKFADLSGEFPAGFDAASIAAGFAAGLVKLKKPGQSPENLTKEMMAKSMAMARGLSFPGRLPRSADAHYDGKGVKKSSAKKPIFWYKPKEDGGFRVLSSDLSFEDAATAPESKTARRL
jgi:hypothetical protein